MSPRRPRLLHEGGLSLAELCAARLDGEIYAIGRCFASIDEFDRPALRAAALAPGLNPRLIAEQRTAAWIWGARQTPPETHEFCAALDARVAHSLASWLVVREVVIEQSDLVDVAELQVTGPLRTAVDLARFSRDFDEDRSTVEALMRLGGFGLLECLTQLDRRRNLPNKRRAAERLAGVHPVDVVDGVNSSHGIQHPIEMGRVTHLEDVAADRETVA